MGWRNLLGLLFFLAQLGGAEQQTPVLAPGSDPVVPVRACGRAGMLFSLSRQGELHRLELAQGASNIIDAPEPLADIACSGGTLWALAEKGRTLYQLDDGGRVLASLTPPVLLKAIAVDGEELFAVQRAMTGGETLLWRGPLLKLSPWALQARQHPGLDPWLASFANSLVVSAGGGRGAAAFYFGLAELHLWAGDGPLRAVRLPTFGQRPSPSTFGANPAGWPRPFRDVLALANGVWVLSGWEGSWAEDPEKMAQGRHVLHVSWGGEVKATYTLPRNGYCLASDDGERVLVLDAFAGVWRVADFAKVP